ncbi:hypothetical protein ACISSW_09000, partial [Escherichia coli]
ALFFFPFFKLKIFPPQIKKMVRCSDRNKQKKKTTAFLKKKSKQEKITLFFNKIQKIPLRKIYYISSTYAHVRLFFERTAAANTIAINKFASIHHQFTHIIM